MVPNRWLFAVALLAWLACAAGARAQDAATRAEPAPAPSALSLPSAREIALASPVPIWQRRGILVEQGGRALYTYTEDLPGQSRCDPKCERLWPPLYVTADAKPHGPFTIARSRDGRPMWAWQGKPLYRWLSDRKRGDAGGDGAADVWFLVKVPPELADQVVAYFPMPMPRRSADEPATLPSQRIR
jgi:predicted lipoprotein with Yx(FWY)xxD motif